MVVVVAEQDEGFAEQRRLSGLATYLRETLTPFERNALVLTGGRGLSEAEAAGHLRCDASRVSEALRVARQRANTYAASQRAVVSQRSLATMKLSPDQSVTTTKEEMMASTPTPPVEHHPAQESWARRTLREARERLEQLEAQRAVLEAEVVAAQAVVAALEQVARATADAAAEPAERVPPAPAPGPPAPVTPTEREPEPEPAKPTGEVSADPREAVLAVIDEGDGPVHWSEIGDRTGLYRTKVFEQLAELLQHGVLVQPKRGMYQRRSARPSTTTPPRPTPTTKPGAAKTRKSPDFPKPDLPPELAMMPAAKLQAPAATIASVARSQREAYDALAKLGRAVPGEIAAEVSGKRDDRTVDGRIRKYVQELEAAGLIVKTGVRRRKHWAPGGFAAGRQSEEYALAGATSTQQAAPPRKDAPPVEEERAAKPPPERAPKAETVEVSDLDLAAVRDFVAQQRGKGPFSPRQVVESTELSLDTVTVALAVWLKRGIVADVGMEGLALFEYLEPGDPGAAAELDRQRARADSAAAGRNGGAAPVAGTGQGQTITNAEVRALVKACTAAGASWEWAQNGHIRITHGKRSTLISGTPRSARSVLNDKARVRRTLDLNLG